MPRWVLADKAIATHLPTGITHIIQDAMPYQGKGTGSAFGFFTNCVVRLEDMKEWREHQYWPARPKMCEECTVVDIVDTLEGG